VFSKVKLDLLAKPKHTVSRYTTHHFISSPGQIQSLTYNHLLLYKSLQAHPLRANLKSFKAFQGAQGGVSAASSLAIKAGQQHRPKSAVVREKLRYQGIGEYLRQKRKQEREEGSDGGSSRDG
jgi:hypothetical protein